MQVIGMLLAVVVGVVLWGLALLFSTAPGLKGSDAHVFFSPIAATMVPLAIFAGKRKHWVLAVWMMALAPIVGIANMGLYGVLASVCFMYVSGIDATPWALATLWLTPVVSICTGKPFSAYLVAMTCGIVLSSLALIGIDHFQSVLWSDLVANRWWVAYFVLAAFGFAGPFERVPRIVFSRNTSVPHEQA